MLFQIINLILTPLFWNHWSLLNYEVHKRLYSWSQRKPAIEFLIKTVREKSEAKKLYHQ